MAFATNTILLLCLMTLAAAKPIMVTFGTRQGPRPIEPSPETPQKPAARTIDVREPAPVSEELEDVPNPQVYTPPVPRQYRNRIFLQRPQPSLILGTPIDRKYTISDAKYENYQKQERSDAGDTGPHVFEKQEYEILQDNKDYQQQVSYIKPHYYQQKLQQEKQKSVPQIGIIYSAGVRYYVPQLVYVDPRQDEEQENSVYDSHDEKFYRAKGQ